MKKVAGLAVFVATGFLVASDALQPAPDWAYGYLKPLAPGDPVAPPCAPAAKAFPDCAYSGASPAEDGIKRELPGAAAKFTRNEAYFDYVTDPDHETHVPVAIEQKNVIVARTFSKAYGMAGLRKGYAIAHPETIKKMRQWVGSSGTGSLNVFGMAAATASIQQDADGAFSKNERMRNKAVRDMVSKWFNDRGMKPTDAQANFMFVNIGTPARAFRDACRAKGVIVARDFPPFEKTHARISLGTMEEMTKAVIESGVLREEADAHCLDGPLSALAIPTTLHDSLMARSRDVSD